MSLTSGSQSLEALPFTPFVGVTPRKRQPRGRAVVGATLLAAADLAAMLAAVGITLLGTNLDAMPQGVDAFLAVRVTLKNVLLLAVLVVAWALTFRGIGLYRETDHGQLPSVVRIFLATGICAGLAAVFPAGGGALRAVALLSVWWLGATLQLLTRFGLRQHMRWWRQARPRQRVMIVGTGPGAMRTYHSLMNDREVGYEVVGFVDDAAAAAATLTHAAGRIVSDIAGLERLLMGHAIDEVFVALPVKSRYLEIHETLRTCERVGVQAKYRADLFDTELAWPRYDPAADHVVTMQVAPDGFRLVIKRAFDVVGAFVLLVVVSPILLASALAVKLTSPGPVVFAQDRYGLNRRHFRMFKFRTMLANAEQLQHALEERNEADGPVFKIDKDPRITVVGRLLRRTSIDELPQLFNVLRGDMSLVGPRPLPERCSAIHKLPRHAPLQHAPWPDLPVAGERTQQSQLR